MSSLTSHRREPPILRIAFLSCAAFIIVLSLVPSGPPIAIGMSDKVAHFGAYALLTLLGIPLVSAVGARAFMVLSIVGLGAALEAVQALVPGREASRGDLVADALGALAGIVLWLALRRASRGMSPRGS